MASTTRRAFLGATAAMARPGHGAAEDRKLKLVVIGVGFYGMIDACRMILGLSVPSQVTAVGGTYCFGDRINTPDDDGAVGDDRL